MRIDGLFESAYAVSLSDGLERPGVDGNGASDCLDGGLARK